MQDEEEEAPGPAFRERFAAALDRAEHAYLRVLRAAILMIATGLILYAAWLGAWSFYKIAQSPRSVEEKVAMVAPEELVDAELPVREVRADGPKVDPAKQRYYAGFVRRYYGLFRTKFEPFRQKEDKQLSRDEFDDAFIDSAARLEAAGKGDLSFESDKDDLETLLQVMSRAAENPTTQRRLQKYKAAKRVRVGKKVQKSRTEFRSGWNSYSMACEDWYVSPIGCSERRAVQVPYTETAYSMEFPKETQSHTQIFRAFQDRFFTLLHDRRQENRMTAESQRAEIVAGNIIGKLTLWDALKILGGFLVLMFFFLLIAIERHQRRIAAQLPVT